MKIKHDKTVISSEMLEHAKKEIVMDDDFIKSIMKKERFRAMTPDLKIGRIRNNEVLSLKFSCHHDLNKFNEVPRRNQHLVTGFGPTNAPTGGTLSIILRALFFRKTTNIDSTIIISNLGAFDSRNINFEKIWYFSNRFLKFIRLLGYDDDLRLHNNYKMLTASAFTAKVLTLKDFTQNEEATANLYKKLGIQGKDFPTLIDTNFTVADILLPLMELRKKRILVFCGIEEHYFPKLANLAVKRLNKKYGELFIPHDSYVSGVFANLIQGLNCYPKMSKSIPASSINLDDDRNDIREKIINCNKRDELIILQMMQLVSDWDSQHLEAAKKDYEVGGIAWKIRKKEYLEYFLQIKALWDKTTTNIPKFNLNDIFNEKRF